MTSGTETTEQSNETADTGEAEERSRETTARGRETTADSRESTTDTGVAAGDPPRVTPRDATGEEPGDSLGWRGWVLVGATVVSFLVVPWAIVFLPGAQGFLASLGLGLRDAYLFLPMVPAVGLGILAVWAAVASRQTD